MNRVILVKKANLYTFDGKKYRTEIKSNNVIILKSLDSTVVLVVDNDLRIIGEVSFTHVDHYTPMLEVDNYNI